MARFPAPAVQYKKDERDRAKHVNSARRDFRALLKAVASDSQNVKALHKKDPKKQQRAMVKLLKGRGDVNAFLDKYAGTDTASAKAYSWRNSARYLLRDAALGIIALRDALPALDKATSNGFQALTVEEFQTPLRSTIPALLREYLPATVEINVDESGTIQRITDRFNNEHFTLEVKIQHQKKLLKQYNQIAKRVKRDLKSSDEITRLSALITAILMETGIRPGKLGNGMVKTVGDQEEFIETFGAITLGPSHVRFVKDNFAELSFLGKKTGKNTASLSGSEIIKALKDYTDKALSSGSKYVFVTADGYRYTYSDLQRYFREHFKGINPTDWRKLKASETVFDAIQAEQEALYAKIVSFAHMEADALAARVAEEIAKTLDRAIAKAQVALSHESSGTTKKQYINPEVLLRFLSTGRTEKTFRDAILGNKPALAFDPQRFIEVASAAAVGRTAAYGIKRAGQTLMEILDEIAKELGLPSTKGKGKGPQ
jgi:integrase